IRTTDVDNNEGVDLKYSSNGGGYNTLRTFRRGTDFANNGTSYTFTVTLTTGLAINSRFRFEGESNSSSEYSYIDNIVITGYPPAPEIDVTGLGNSIIGNNTNTPTLTDNTDFGTAQIVSETITKTFVIRNTGSANLTLGNIILSGTTDFSLDSAPTSGTVMAPNATQNVVVSFSSATIGVQNDLLTIPSNDSNEASYRIRIKADANKVFFDSDGDGIYDDVDIDDDNDGIIDTNEEKACRLSGSSSQADYKFLNETFGTG